MANQHIALITGANQGVGFQIAKALVENGYIVFVGSRNLQNGEKAAATLGENAYAIQIDVTQQASIDSAAEVIKKQYSRLDLLVNNAGISHAGKPGRTLEEMMETGKALNTSIAEMKTVWDTNVFGVLAVTQTMLPLLRQAKAARIVNVSSGLGSLTYNATPGFPYRTHFGVVYAASKAALNAVTIALSIELEGEGIMVNATSPGFTATALNNFQGTDSVEEGSKDPIRVALDESLTTGRFTGPEGVIPW